MMAPVRDLTWAAVAVVIGIFLIVVWRSARVADRYLTADGAENGAETSATTDAETPGGFAPIPEFSTTAAEVRFRGASCAGELSGLEAHLYRVCASRE
jgi:hypothetical protein